MATCQSELRSENILKKDFNDDEVEFADILEPFSNSKEPLFHEIIPCCIHEGKFSYASCNLPSKSLAVDALFARTAMLTLSLKTA